MDDVYGDPRNYDPNEDDPYRPAPPPPQSPPTEHGPGWIPPLPTTPPRAGYHWEIDPRTNEWVETINGGYPQTADRPGFDYEREPTAIDRTNLYETGGVPTTFGGTKPIARGYGDPYGDMPDYSRMLPYPEYEKAPAFAFDPFTASSWADAENEPGYQASRTNLRKQIEAGAAYKGMLRSGMTIGDLYSNLDALSQQNFRQFDERRFRNWGGNLGLAKTKHDYVVSDIDRANNYRWNSADASFKDVLDRWKTKVNSLTQLARPVD